MDCENQLSELENILDSRVHLLLFSSLYCLCEQAFQITQDMLAAIISISQFL